VRFTAPSGKDQGNAPSSGEWRDSANPYPPCRSRGIHGLLGRLVYRWIEADSELLVNPMLVVTTENVAHYRVVEIKGQCFGVVVRSRGLGGNIMAGLRSIVGGEIHEYTQLLEEARRHAVDRLVQNATAMGGNAVLMMRFDSAEIGQTMSEIVAYGTAAVIEPIPG
jgi:uncharacterized protein YbjQ (UPF0145 family)